MSKIDDYRGYVPVTIKRREAVKKVRSKPRAGRLRGDALQRLRLACFARDNNICQVCWCTVFPHMEHTEPRSAHMAHDYGPTRTKPCPPKVPVHTRGEL